jgi:hypothetical protein
MAIHKSICKDLEEKFVSTSRNEKYVPQDYAELERKEKYIFYIQHIFVCFMDRNFANLSSLSYLQQKKMYY